MQVRARLAGLAACAVLVLTACGTTDGLEPLRTTPTTPPINTAPLTSSVPMLPSDQAAELPPEPTGSQDAQPVAAVPTVGALFPDGLDSAHTCTGSVIESPGRDLVLTAAHCIVGTGQGMLFVPGYAGGDHADGVFEVQRVWADPAWVEGTDPRHDYALLRVTERDTGSGVRLLQDVTGALRLSAATPAAGTPVEVTGYVGGLLDRPISCDPVIELTQTYPGFNCGGFASGTSGSPLVVGTDAAGVVVGVIGGLHQGGCVEQVSYSSPFGSGVGQLLARAEAGTPGDALPPPGDDGC